MKEMLRMRKAVLCAVLCLIGAFCIGAGVQEGSKAAPEAGAQIGAYAVEVEVWRVTETRRWTYDDGSRGKEKLEYDMFVWVEDGHAESFYAVDDYLVWLWEADPPTGSRPWNDYTQKRPYVCFAGEFSEPNTSGWMVGQLRLNKKWVRATGTIRGAINAYGWNAYLDAKVRAVYVDTI